MKTFALFSALILSAVSAHAGCVSSDKWTGPDKAKHFAVGAAIGSGGVLMFNKPREAFWAGVIVGAAKEAYDSRGHGTCSAQDFAVTALGAAAGAYGTAWIVTPRFIGFASRF